VLESFVSRYENHFDIRRNTNEETANQEFEIAVNGSNLANCDSVVSEARDAYWRGKDAAGAWNFFKTNVIEKLTTYDGGSQVLHRITNNRNNLPFTD
jgi:hypothetical protein